MKDKLKLWIDANVWDGEDRSGAVNDFATFNPDELLELIFDMYDSINVESLSEMTASKFRIKQLESLVESYKGKYYDLLDDKKGDK